MTSCCRLPPIDIALKKPHVEICIDEREALPDASYMVDETGAFITDETGAYIVHEPNPLAVFGLFPPARAAYCISQRLTSGWAAQIIDLVNENTLALTQVGAGSGVGGALDEAAIAAACPGVNGRIAWLYDQSGNGYHLPAIPLNAGGVLDHSNVGLLPLIYESGAVTKVNGKPSIKFPSPGNTAQNTGAAFRLGNTGSVGGWRPEYTLGLSGSPALTIALVARCRDDGVGSFGQAGVLGRYAFGIGEYYASQIGLAVDTMTQTIESYGAGGGANTYNFAPTWPTVKHVVITHQAGGTIGTDRVWMNGVEQTRTLTGTSPLNLQPTAFGAVSMGCNVYAENFGLFDTRAWIVWDGVFSAPNLALLFQQLDQLAASA